VTSRDCWYRRHLSVWITCVKSLHCFSPLSILIYSLTFNFDLHQFSLHLPILLSPHYHIHCILTTSINIMSDNCCHSPSLSAHCSRADESSDEPMSHQDQAHRRSDKRRAPRSPSPHHSCSPSREGQHKKHRRVKACDTSPSPDRWCATTTGLLLYDRDHQCPTCLEYQKHVSLDIVLETLGSNSGVPSGIPIHTHTHTRPAIQTHQKGLGITLGCPGAIPRHVPSRVISVGLID